MTATTNASYTRGELREEYRIALRIWSEARALYAGDSSEIERAAEQLKILERQLLELEATTGEDVLPALGAEG